MSRRYKYSCAVCQQPIVCRRYGWCHVEEAGKQHRAEPPKTFQTGNVANIHLIAAAPELLELLKWALCTVRVASEYEQSQYDKAVAAIAHAEGQG